MRFKNESRRDDTMPSSYVSNHVHIVFNTKNRVKVIPEDLQPKLGAYIVGIAKKRDGFPRSRF
jgi:hypothetical protein